MPTTPLANHDHVVSRGALTMLGASLCLSAMGATVRLLTDRLPTAEIVFFRCALAWPFLTWLVMRRGISPVPRAWGLVLLRSLFGLTAMIASFWSLGRLPLADVSMLGRLEPLLVAALAPWILGEHADRRVWLSIGISVIGVALVMQPSFAVGNVAGLVMVGAAIAGAFAHLIVRRVAALEDPAVIVLGFVTVTALITGPAMLPSFVLPGWRDGLMLVAIAVLATLGQLLMTKAYALERAAVVSSVSYVQVLFGVAWGFVLFGEIPNHLVWVGGAIITASGVYLLTRRSGSREPAPQQP